MENPTGFDLISAFSHAGIAGICVFIILMFMSLASWGLFFFKWYELDRLFTLSENFFSLFWRTKNLSELYDDRDSLPNTSLKALFEAGYEEAAQTVQHGEKKGTKNFTSESVKRTLSQSRYSEQTYLGKHLYLFSLIASIAPFVGLFGTVLGIIRSFKDIGVLGSANLTSIAPGIAEALIATALGLFVAIPAAIFYHVLVQKTQKHLVIIDHFNVEFINSIERYYS